MRDVTDLFNGSRNGTRQQFPTSADGYLDDTLVLKVSLFEASSKTSSRRAKQPGAVGTDCDFITMDEGGASTDSGFVQPVDFFGTGPRIPADRRVDVFHGRHISHVYSEHSPSEVCRAQLEARRETTTAAPTSANPVRARHPYVPQNMPAIGDLFDCSSSTRRLLPTGPPLILCPRAFDPAHPSELNPSLLGSPNPLHRILKALARQGTAMRNLEGKTVSSHGGGSGVALGQPRCRRGAAMKCDCGHPPGPPDQPWLTLGERDCRCMRSAWISRP